MTARGGLARVATLKRRLSEAGLTTILLLAGDFLSPSVASSVFKGEQMVAALNAAGVDMATFGNHEFDFGVDVLRQRMKESKWQWVASNLVDDHGKPMAGTVPYIVRTFGSLRVGFIGLISTTEQMGSERLRGIVADRSVRRYRQVPEGAGDGKGGRRGRAHPSQHRRGRGAGRSLSCASTS